MRPIVAFLLALLASIAAAQAQNEAQVFNAFAVVAAQGTIVRSADKRAFLAGTLKGPMFIETDEGPVEAGSVTCSTSMRFDRESRHQIGSGACTFTAPDGAIAWGEWECTGYELVGCHGKLVLNGGAGRLQGVSGEGAMVWRPSAHELTKQLDGSATLNTTGIVIWRDFKITKK